MSKDNPKKLQTDRQCYYLYWKASRAGFKAFEDCNPTPMVVGTAKGLSNEIDRSKEMHYVSDGVCGFASIKIYPARGRFVKWLKDMNIGYTSAQGGYSLNVSSAKFGQSLERKEAYAKAFTKVLQNNGLEAYVESRMD